MTIDVHAHVVLEATFGAAGEHGPVLDADEEGRPRFRAGGYVLHGVRYRDSPFMDVGRRLVAMDAAGIDYQVLSPNPITYFHRIDPTTAVAFCRRHNDALAEVVAASPGRLGGLAALPMQDVGAAVAELRRATGELGLSGAAIGTDLGRPLDDAALDLFYDAVAGLDVPLFLHPAPAGVEGPPADPRLSRFDLDLLVGFAAEEALAVATLVYGGVLQRHPDLDVWVSHGGGAIPYLLGRLRAAAAKRPWAPTFLAGDGFDAAVRRLWFDTLLHDAGALRLLVDAVGTERLVLGTNFAGWDQGTTAATPTELAPALEANARRLLRLPPP